MSLLYNGVVGYERLRNFWGAIIMSIIGVILIIVGVYTFFYPPQPIPNNTPSTTKDPPPVIDSAYTWAITSGIGVIFIIIAGVMLFLATDQSETTKNILAVQGTYNAFNSIFGNRRNGGNFDIGE